MTKQISHAARALVIGVVVVLVLTGTANAYVIDTKEYELVAKNILVPITTATPTVLLSSAIPGDTYILEISGYGSLDIGNYNAGNADYEWRELGSNGQWNSQSSKRFALSDAPRINGQHISPIDSSFNPNHVYYVEVISEKSTLEMLFYDSVYSDNSGSFNVNVYHKLSVNKQASSQGLVAEYHFDGDAKDSSGNGNDGTIYGATFVDGKFGKALSFDGVNDYVSIADPASGVLDFGMTDGFTVELFVKYDVLGDRGPTFLLSKGYGSDAGYYHAIDWTHIAFGVTDGTTQIEARFPHSGLSIGKWYQVVGVRDVKTDRVDLYLDGVLVATSVDTTTSTLASPITLYIGKKPSGYYFGGSIDEVRIYNRALSAEEIKANYDSIIGKSPATTATKPASAPTSPPATIAQTTIPTPAPTAAPESSNSYVYAGIGGIILLLVAIVALKRRSSSKVEEPLKREPTVKPEPQKPTPLAEPPKSKPAPVTVPEAPGVYVKTAFGYKGAAIIYKLKIENNTSDPISDIKVYPYVPDVFLLKEKEKSIALIEPKSSQTVTFEIRPTGECGDCNVSGRVNYYDMESRKRQDIELEQKSLSIVCPMLHGKEISETEWYDVVSNLVKTEESTREIGMPADSLFTMVSRVIKDMHMHMQKPEVTKNHKLFNGVARFYGEGVKGLKYAAQVEVVGGAKKSKLILKVWAEKEEALTGFYHGMLDEIEKRVNVKEYIDDSIVQYNVHIGDKIGTLVKDSVVQRSNIGASARKCPNCDREVEANEKFCLECGARL